MEIETAPHRPAATPWGRLVLFVVIFGPVTALVLLPIGLGLQRFVVSGDSMDGSLGQGTIVFERVVPVSDLHVGDVITFRPPPPADRGSVVTHRVVAIGADGIRTRGDAMTAVDPWTLRPQSPTVSRVVFSVPWVGWAYLLLLHPRGWVLTVLSAAFLVALTSRGLLRRRLPIRWHRHDSSPGADTASAADAQLERANP